MMERTQATLFLANSALSHHKFCISILGICYCSLVAFIHVVEKYQVDSFKELGVLTLGKLGDTVSHLGTFVPEALALILVNHL